MTELYKMKLKKCCGKLAELIKESSEAHTGLWFKEEGHLWNAGEDIFMDFELIYCPICGKRIEWEGDWSNEKKT